MHETPDTILVVDFGSQYTQLIARRIRELNVYSHIVPFTADLPLGTSVRGIILSGGPASVCSEGSPTLPIEAYAGRLPILGICYGAQLITQQYGGKVAASANREFGRAQLHTEPGCALFAGLPDASPVWMSHSDTIRQLPERFRVVGATEAVPIAAFAHAELPLFGLQFHPEVTHSAEGLAILRNFVLDVCMAKPNWTAGSYVETTVRELQTQLEGASVVCALSGGVDSLVAAELLRRAIGNRLHCVFVDTGLMRKGEFGEVMRSFRALGLNIKGVREAELFLGALQGLADPEQKRKTIGRVFIDVFEREANQLSGITHLAQGTIYPDVIESVSVNGPSVTIKSHHNVGGLPERMNLKVVEPLRYLFKDEVRRVGRELGLPADLLGRHPFPGPGLAIRIPGEITPEKVRLLQEADEVFIAALRGWGLYDEVWQAFSVLLPVSSVGVMGDERTYENVLALRAVTSLDGMTADWARLPYDFLADVANRIINHVKGINRVVYDISSKPPATIEWE